MTLQTDFIVCINDTRKYVSAGAAARLCPWQYYPPLQFITAVQNAIRIPRNKEHGWQTHRNGGMSLEGIVLKYDVFNAADKATAKQTLGIT